MKRLATEEKPYLSFAIIARNAAETLEPCLKSIRERAPTAEIVVVDTCSNDLPSGQESNEGPFDLRYPKSHQIAQKYADVWEEYKGPRGDWSTEMYAFDDAAAARNRSFQLCSGKWICWIDADDVLPGPEEAERLLKLNARWKPGPSGQDSALGATPVTLENFLRFVDEKVPQTQGFKCPYLYQSKPDGTAVTWQERERIVRNNGRWHWQRPAHEILVPKNVQDYSQLHNFSHFLFVHKKKFTPQDTEFSLKRHFNILIREYESGARNLQGLLYLENFSIFLCPQRRPEFIKAAYEAACNNIDRARALIRKGNFASDQGFYLDAIEAFAGATAIAGSFPDGWASGAHALEKADNPLRAAEWLIKAVECPTDCSVSDVNPRAQAIEFRIRAGMLLLKGARRLVSGGRLAEAQTALENAVLLAKDAANHPAIADDRAEAILFMQVFQNELDALKQAQAIKSLHHYLVKNDETQKAMELLKIVPHNLQDHPDIVAIEKWAAPLEKHFTDKEAYRKFYDEIGTDIVSCETGLDYNTTLARVQFAINWIRKHKPDAKVLEIGGFDGITALPILRSCPDVQYTVMETKKDALQRTIERAEKFNVAHRLKTAHGLLDDARGIELNSFDIVIFYEVIEHVPDPIAAVKTLFGYMKSDGRLFLSTPWGAFDRGHPPFADRDARGHVRAMSTKDFVDTIEEAGGRVLELAGDHQPHNYGDTQYLIAEKTLGSRLYRQKAGGVSFMVPGALWDWNATHVEQTGIGASEETIVYLARHMGQLGRDVDVFGPVPVSGVLADEEVRDGVKYWTREKTRHASKLKPLIVSRAPSIGATVDHPDRLLWLQDAWYPDLNAEVAKAYRKIVVLTEWHKQVMHQNHQIPLEQMEIIENFLLTEQFAVQTARDRNKFVYASSPDRGLINLLKIWPHIRANIPDATLHIFYGWEGCIKLSASSDPTWTDRYRKIRSQFLELRYQPGIVERGRINHVELAREFLSSAAWLYPTAFDETGCLTAAKARAAGCVPVCTPRAALNETAKCALTEFVPMDPMMDLNCTGFEVEKHADWERYVHDFVSATLSARDQPDGHRLVMMEEARQTYNLEAIYPKWRRLIAG